MMLSPFNIIDTKSNQIALEEYSNNSAVKDLPTQMLAVMNFISHFWHQNDKKADKLFVENFPKDLYNQFLKIKQDKTIIDEYHEMKISLFDAFSFIFRNHNMLLESETQKFIDLFLGFIEKREDISSYDAHALIDSVIICVSHKPNRIKFIEENCMFNLFYTFIKGTDNLADKFWIMCEDIYRANLGKCDTLCISKLNKCAKAIMTTFWMTADEESARLLLMLFTMLYHQKLFDITKFEVSKFYSITLSIFNNHLEKCQDSLLLAHLPKIWIGIFNRPTNVFKINNCNRLTIFAALFSISISNKFRKIIQGYGKFKMTKTKNQMLNVIYFALVAFPRLGKVSKILLINVLTTLHMSFKEYLDKCSIEDLPFESQFIIVQYFIKSFVTLKIDISLQDDEVLNRFFKRIVTYPSPSSIF
ncbi:hypothetical protein RF11_08055 [Thelohanellus kitauei]|uniref:Uncharacterized protein n=1 Tax=Thelohanellus kitauei TaxID=669202 RepID=A0A0C2M958_THEKT|nr:hypothetical protein RF11_08055 [Thelohanellus kitauei]